MHPSRTIYNGYILAKLLQGGYFLRDYPISFSETQPDIVQKAAFATDNVPVTVYGTNTSYAFLQVGDPVKDAGRRAEWKDTSNSLDVVISDRWNGQGGLGKTLSVRNNTTGDAANNVKDAKEWFAVVGWNDNHVGFATAILAQTKYDKTANTAEGLFSDTLIDPSVPGATSTPGANAFMQYTTW